MITWLLLSSLFCTQDGNGQEIGVLQCGPRNMTLSSSDQTILLAWEDDPSCSGVHGPLIYVLVVLVADKQVYNDEVAVTPDLIGSTHFWNWTSYLPLECSTHSVRLSTRYKNYVSPWEQEQTLPGIESSSQVEVYPRDRTFIVGSTVTFCCVLPEGERLDKFFLTGYSSTNMNISKISSWTYSLTVGLNQPSNESCTDVKCKPSVRPMNGACVFIGYPPGDEDLQCETRDLESVECHWTVGRDTHLTQNPTTYQLLGRPCADGTQGTCSQKEQVQVGERSWTVMAQNPLGKVELTDRADLTKRVHMFAPVGVTASTVNARNVRLEWRWTVQQYNNLNLTCQVNIRHGGTNTMSQTIGVGLRFAVLTDLIPNWRYNVTVRCGTTQHFWKWSNWSASFNFQTKGDAPCALDVWMQKKDVDTIIVWKMPLAHQSHGHIIDYTVTWMKSTEAEQPNRTTVAHTKHHFSLRLDTTEEYVVTVTARNINGSSSPSTIIIPRSSPDVTSLYTSRIIGNNGSFHLSWSASPRASCGYIVDWCPNSGHCIVDWIKVPPHQTSANIVSKHFKGGLRYTLSIYACTQGAPVLLERREGYVKEEKIQDGLFKTLRCKQQGSDCEVSWDPVPLTEQTAFIQGYVLYWSESNKSNIVYDVSTDNPEAHSLIARNLKISSYNFTVKALTALGEGGTTSCNATINSQTDNLIKVIFISLVIVFSLLSLITILCYRHWGCIKQKVYPPIPKPLLTDTWFRSPIEHSCHILPVEECHPSEVDIMDVPELRCKPGALVNNDVSNENIPYVFAPTPKNYYNHSLKNCNPSPLILPSTMIPSQSGLPTSPFRSVFPNPSYDLIIETDKQQCNPEPELLERNSGGYQPQGHTESFTPNHTEGNAVSPFYCASTYILLPQSPSK